jgi:hypothetical protein
MFSSLDGLLDEEVFSLQERIAVFLVDIHGAAQENDVGEPAWFRERFRCFKADNPVRDRSLFQAMLDQPRSFDVYVFDNQNIHGTVNCNPCASGWAESRKVFSSDLLNTW